MIKDSENIKPGMLLKGTKNWILSYTNKYALVLDNNKSARIKVLWLFNMKTGLYSKEMCKRDFTIVD
tara:strand:+ start:415 stop:615 length:201 start_codon:yes stop_codon:yes gene_type:complete